MRTKTGSMSDFSAQPRMLRDRHNGGDQSSDLDESGSVGRLARSSSPPEGLQRPIVGAAYLEHEKLSFGGFKSAQKGSRAACRTMQTVYSK